PGPKLITSCHFSTMVKMVALTESRQTESRTRKGNVYYKENQHNSRHYRSLVLGALLIFKVAQRTMKVIIDTDPGLDDAMAVLVALDAHKKGLIKILGVTLTHGNTSLDNAACNMMRTLTTVKMEKEQYAPFWNLIPQETHLSMAMMDLEMQNLNQIQTYHSFLKSMLSVLSHVSQEKILVCLLFSHRHCYNSRNIKTAYLLQLGEVVLIALGPLTNVALAMRMDPSLGGNLKEIFIMGGNSEGLGNVTPCAEFNFHCDPEAAYTVLQECKCPTYLITWELCLKRAELTLDWRKNVLGKVSTPEARLMNSIEAKSLSLYKYQTYIVCDQIAVAVAIYRNLIIASSDHYASVELHGMFTRGQMVVDYISAMNRKPNVTMVEKIDVEAFKKILMVAFGHKVEM
ncbi:unnamed protein product, partial [Darwinula stevensoni]